MQVLVVEDDGSIADAVMSGLSRQGFQPTLVTTGRAALDHDGTPDLVLLDLGLPDLDGTEVCRQLRDRSNVPIIIMSARSDEVDRVLLLESGADDYVVKPFGMRELVARIRAVARRSSPDVTSQEPADDVIEAGAIRIDPRTRRVTVDGDEVALTPKEFDLLRHLAADPGAVMRRRDILEEVWEPNWFGSAKTLDVHVASLRRKLGHADWIEAVRGVGFRLVERPGV